ncbi:MAG: CHASE2 domain-containing protein [Leptolyngbya sp. UWPOB_LEPTO1]|uniref:CHASE2 domain-containing protein n=1 Tax=Leptolyngbya sp. UWPOB_LEPTO1 TaxID=2815653 RepID=UPI001AD4E0E6|nr:CHASE2 domain-containing protein [Leptolyngbya sp. UWPOB_LEPTO1]MBN8564004.1 CHASE2 domain-containing protein [Leptolyngbya sp. UWPOB_LEPTO1]
MRQWVRVSLSTIATATAVLGMQLAGAFQQLELMVLDQWFRARLLEPVDSRLVIVTIDESDFNSLRQYPISDELLAELLTKIQRQKPRVVGMDLYRNLPVEPGHAALQKVYSQMSNLIGIEKTISGNNFPSVDPPPILRQRNQIAASDIVLDHDGKVRRNLLSLRVNKLWGKDSRTLETLGTRLALEYLKAEGITPRPISGTSQIQLGRARLEALSPTTGGYVRADTGGFQLMANFRNLRQRFTSVSFNDVLQDRVPAGLMQDRIVVIGSIAESLNDRFFTPYSQTAQMTSAGVEVHADFSSQLISAAIEGRPLLRGVPAGVGGAWLLIWLGGGAVLGWRVKSLRLALILAVGVTLSGIAGTYLLFLAGWWMPIVAPILGMKLVALTMRMHLVWRSLSESHDMLQHYAKTLEQKVEERTQALKQQNLELMQAKQEAEAADRAKTTFLANVNHELRTPLSIILSSSELMGYDKSLAPKQKERLTMITQSVQHLLDLINGVLELAKLEANAETVELQAVSIPQMLHSLEELYQPQAIARDLTLTLHCDQEVPEWVQTDECKLRQVLMNLLTNALKFTQQGAISLRVLWIEASRLRFEVEDTGIGIAPHEMQSLFKPFMQTESGRRSGQGSGLGLSISQQLLQLLGSKLQVHSTLQVGTMFWFDLDAEFVTSAESDASASEVAITHLELRDRLGA